MRNLAVVVLCLLAVPAWSFGQELIPRQTFTGWFASTATAAQRPRRADGVSRSNPKSDASVSDSQPVAQSSLSDFAIDACNSRGCAGNCGGNCGSGCGGVRWGPQWFSLRGVPQHSFSHP